MRKTPPILPAIFLASLSGLAYEITLTRIFSISLWYHFAFMVISIAMLGIGASGTLLAVFPKIKKESALPFFFILFSLSIPASYLLINAIPFDPARLSWDRTQLFYISLYYLFLSLPFFSFGLIVSTAFSLMSRSSGHIYAADMTGAGAGSVLILWLLTLGGPGKAVFIIASISALPILIIGDRRKKILALCLIALNLGILYVNPRFINPHISPYKPLETALKFPGAKLLKTYNGPVSRVDVIKSPAVRYAPGLSLTYLKDLPEQTGLSVDAGDLYAVTNNTDLTSLDFLRFLPASLPYEISPKKAVLVLEPKGGLAVLTAACYGATDVHKVDSDPLVIRAVRELPGAYSSGIYDKNTRAGTGRSWLASSRKNFDLIDISLTGSVPSGSFGFSEDYRSTVEAFEEYLRHLGPDGMLSVNLFILPPPRTELRLLAVIAAALEKQGITDIKKHIAAIRSWSTVTLLIKKSPLSEDEIRAVKSFSRDRRFDLVYYHGISEKETNVYVKMPSSEYFSAFMDLISKERRAGFIDGYLFDIRPVYDENPFFHYYLKLRNIKEIYLVMGEKWQYFLEEGYLLPVIFVQVLFLGMVLVLIPALKRKRTGNGKTSDSLFLPLSYFAFLGTGYMFVEISFIQKMVLPLENPSYALSSVLASMLISSGAGSLLSQHFSRLRKPFILLLLAVAIYLYSLFLPFASNIIQPHPLPLKIAAVFFILLPAGLLMGIPFPVGLSLLGRHDQTLLPWAWAVNGCFSVLAPILAVMCAISAGFKAVLLTGMLMYIFAYLGLRKLGYANDTSRTKSPVLP